MEIVTKFNIGERVWVMNPESVTKVTREKCKACGGTGAVPLKDKTSIHCPRCKGEGEIQHREYSHKPMSGTVSYLMISQLPGCSLDGGKEIEVTYFLLNPKARNCHNRRGSYSEITVFKTKKECQKAIEEKRA